MNVGVGMRIAIGRYTGPRVQVAIGVVGVMRVAVGVLVLVGVLVGTSVWVDVSHLH